VDIFIHPKVKQALIFITIVVMITAGTLAIRSSFFPSAPITTQIKTGDRAAAEEGALAFYTLDYTESSELWIARVCARSTMAGCEVIKNFFAPAVRATVEKHRVQSDCSVQAIRLIADNGNTRIWDVTVTMNNPWVGLTSPTQDVYIEVARSDGRWLMNRILFDQEKQRYPTPVPVEKQP
jgi:hypothetical protein